MDCVTVPRRDDERLEEDDAQDGDAAMDGGPATDSDSDEEQAMRPAKAKRAVKVGEKRTRSRVVARRGRVEL
jgi:hypothetical protein